MKTLWKFKTKNFTVTYHAERETFDPTFMEPETVRECREKIRRGEWKCFTAVVSVRHNATGQTLGQSYLGQCIYADPKEFTAGGYLRQMVQEAVEESRGLLVGQRKNVASHLQKLQRGLLKDAA